MNVTDMLRNACAPQRREGMIDINKTFVTSDHHFRAWAHFGGALSESTKEEDEQHIALEQRHLKGDGYGSLEFVSSV